MLSRHRDEKTLSLLLRTPILLSPTSVILLLVTTTSLHLPQLATLVPFFKAFDYGGACQQCLALFFFHLHFSSIRRVLDMKTAVVIVPVLVIS